jgi:hypothetical protein
MASFEDVKEGLGSVYPVNAVTAAYERLEPIISFNELKTRYLFGIPLVSAMVDPTTKTKAKLEPEDVKIIIDGAIQRIEMDLNIDIYSVQRKERYPFDAPAIEKFGYLRTEHAPINSISSMTITAPNNTDIYTVPLDWISPAYFIKGQINILPWLASSQSIGGIAPSGNNGGAFFLSVLGMSFFNPAYWQLVYTTGFPDGMVPRVVNDLIGISAAIDILSMLGATYARSTSASLSLDGMAQAVAQPGPNIYQVRIENLEIQKEHYIGKVKSAYSKRMFVSNI